MNDICFDYCLWRQTEYKDTFPGYICLQFLLNYKVSTGKNILKNRLAAKNNWLLILKNILPQSKPRIMQVKTHLKLFYLFSSLQDQQLLKFVINFLQLN